MAEKEPLTKNKKITIDSIYVTTTIIEGLSKKSHFNWATGFFFQENEEVYLVTNKHVIYDKNYFSRESKPLIDSIKIKLHTDSSNLSKNEDVKIDLFDKENNKIWLEHSESKIDVVLIPLKIDREKYKITSFDKSSMDFTNIKLDIAEKIIVMGYPYAWYDDHHNIPICRVGHLMGPHELGFRRNSFILGDVETHPGMSGAPVFTKIRNPISEKDEMKLGGFAIRLMGILSGAPVWPVGEEKITPNIIIIWLPNLILEILEQNIMQE